jgi:glycosyltransferase involved in cell wall biosynthesis
MRKMLGDSVSRLVVAGPEVTDEEYRKLTGTWLEVDEREEGIVYHRLHAADASNLRFAREFPKSLVELARQVTKARVIHAGPSFLYRPHSISSLVLGAMLGKVTVSVTDIDQRESARMNYETGVWSAREYWTTRLLHDTFEHLQHLWAARWCSLVLLKGKQLADDYGHGKPNVRGFLDSAFGCEHIISESALQAKLARVSEAHNPLRFTFYGRLVPYKGVDHMLRALAHALRTPGFEATFDVYGDGPERSQLVALTADLGIERAVRFHGAVPFGPEFFERLYGLDVLLAAPLSQDTPRSALDAQAAGQFVLGYDTYYYRDLAGMGASVQVVPWRDERALGDAMVALHRDRRSLVTGMEAAVRFARANTQESWLERRFAWLSETLRGGAANAGALSGAQLP